MQILVVDNETTVRKGLVSLLEKVMEPPFQITEADSVESGFQTLQEARFDVVFLDVELGDGTGFDLLRKLNQFDFHLIIITAYNKYAVEAFRFCALDFIQKPIGAIELLETMRRVKRNALQKELESQISMLEEKLAGTRKLERIALNDSENIHYVQIDQIILCESEGSYTTFFLSGGRRIVVSKIIKEYEEMLDEYGFLRVHHSFLINTKKVLRFEKAEGGTIVLEENLMAPVSKRKKDTVLKMLKS
jgi:two-component system LytT family response regulator